MSRYCKIVVLPEDPEHADLARGYLKGRNVNERAYELTRRWTGRNGNNAVVREWFCTEVEAQVNANRGRRGILALIDEDGQGLVTRQNEVNNELKRRGLLTINPEEGRCLVLPMRNVETWMVWAARWQAAGSSASPAPPPAFQLVSELNNYKLFKEPGGNPIPKEPLAKAYDVGKIIAKLNPIAPPTGIPPALQSILQPLSDFLAWATIK